MNLPLIPPMLATPGTLPPAAQDARWAYETKQDGQRAVVYLPGDGSVLLRARSGEDITGAYPELRPLGAALGTTPAILDGEVLALDAQGRADFQLLQSRMGLGHAPARAARRAAQVPVHLVLFDVMHLGRPLLKSPYTRRRARLEELALEGPHWSTPAAAPATAPRRCGPPGSMVSKAWCASGWTRCTSRGCALAPGSRSGTSAART